jgi:hypothetical protein
VQEAQRQLLVVAGRAHGHGERGAVDADLQRLLHRHGVELAVVLDLGVHPPEANRAHVASVLLRLDGRTGEA